MPGGHYRGPTSVGPPARCLGSCDGCRTREGTVPAGTVPSGSPAQAEPLDERPVPVDVGLGQVVQQPATTTDQQEQPPPAVVVVLVLLEVLGQVADPAGQHRDLHLGRTGVLLDRRVLGHDLLLRRAVERHGSPPGLVTCGPRSLSRGQAAHRSGQPTVDQATSEGGGAPPRRGRGGTTGRSAPAGTVPGRGGPGAEARRVPDRDTGNGSARAGTAPS